VQAQQDAAWPGKIGSAARRTQHETQTLRDSSREDERCHATFRLLCGHSHYNNYSDHNNQQAFDLIDQ
jgi:hypothetical protein